MGTGDQPPHDALLPIEQDTVELFGHPVLAVRLPDGRIAALLRAMCQALDLNRSSQVRRIRADDTIADQLLSVRISTPGGPQDVDMLTAWAIPTWLTGIRLGMLPAPKRPAIQAFKREAADVLYRHFAQPRLPAGAASALVAVEHPSPPPSLTVPATTTTVAATDVAAQALIEQIAELGSVTNLLREHLAALLGLPGQVEELAQQVTDALHLLARLQDRQDAAQDQLTQIDARTQHLTPAHARAVQELVDRMVRETKRLPVPLTYAVIYGRLKHRFRAGSYRDIPDDRFDDLTAFLFDELRRAKHDGAEDTPRQGSLL